MDLNSEIDEKVIAIGEWYAKLSDFRMYRLSLLYVSYF